MKLLALFTLFAAGFAFAGATSLGHIESTPIFMEIAGDDIICSQPFDYGNLQNGVGFNSGNSWMIADDFTYGSDATIDMIEIWAIYGGGNATGVNIEIREDASGPGAVYSSGASLSATHENTGLSQWGYPLWYTEIVVDDLYFEGGNVYWLALQTTGSGGPDYWLAGPNTSGGMTHFSQDNGASWVNSQTAWGAAYDQYMIISGEEGGSSLSRDTWGAIKTLF